MQMFAKCIATMFLVRPCGWRCWAACLAIGLPLLIVLKRSMPAGDKDKLLIAPVSEAAFCNAFSSFSSELETFCAYLACRSELIPSDRYEGPSRS